MDNERNIYGFAIGWKEGQPVTREELALELIYAANAIWTGKTEGTAQNNGSWSVHWRERGGAKPVS